MALRAAPTAPERASIDPRATARERLVDRWSHPAKPFPALAALGFYGAGVAVLARGLLLSLNTSIIGPLDGDNFWFAWCVWYFRRALLSGHDPNYTGDIRALTASVPVFTDGFFNQLLGVPLQSVFSPLGAYDVTILLSFVLGGLAMYLLASAFTRSWVACLVAGLVYTFCTYHFGRATMHLGLLTVQMLPFCAWRLVLFVRDASWRNALLAGLGVGLVPWADVYYGAYFLVIFGVCFAAGVAITDWRWFTRPQNLARCALVAAVAAVVAVPSIYAYILAPPEVRAGVAAEASTGAKVGLSADLSGFFLPDPTNPALGRFVERFFVNQSVFPARSVFLGFPAIALAVLCFCFRASRTRLALGWLVLALASVALALGPEVRVAGHDAGRYLGHLSPYSLVFGLPVLSNFRGPGVIGIVAMLAVSVLAALGATSVLAAVKQGRLRVGVGAALVALVAVGLLPSTTSTLGIASFEVPTPDLYRQIAASPDNGLLLDVPTYIASAQYFQTIHGKRIVGGILPREPASALTALDTVPYLWLLDSWRPVPDSDSGIVGGKPADVYPLPSFVEGLREHGVSWVVLHRFLCADPPVNTPYYCPELPYYESIRRFLTGSLGRPLADEMGGTVTAWHVADAPASTAPQLAFSLGEGWSWGLVSAVGGDPWRLMRSSARLVVVASSAERVRIQVRAWSYIRPMTMDVLLNGRSVGAADLGLNTPRDLDLGTVELQRGANVLDLRSAQGCVRVDFDPRNCWSFGVQRVDATPA